MKYQCIFLILIYEIWIYCNGSSVYQTIKEDIQNFDLSNTALDLRVVYIDASRISFTFNISWNSISWGKPYNYEIEISEGEGSLEFKYLETVSLTSSYLTSYNQIICQYDAINLLSSSYYNFRVIFVYHKGRGRPSDILTTKTLEFAEIYWEPIISRPSSPSSTPNPVLPSSRRGHTLSLISDAIYMFGGRTDGFSCALTYKDVLSYGSPESGRMVYPCTSNALEVQELWKLDIYSYEWTIINSTNPTQTPHNREQHNAIVVNGNLYIFGGKRRDFEFDKYGNPILIKHKDIIYGDFYMLKFENSKKLQLYWPVGQNSKSIPQDNILYASINGNTAEYNNSFAGIIGDGINALEGMCVSNVAINVTLTHSCINQLRISLFGPGPVTSSHSVHASFASHEVLLYNQRLSNSSKCINGLITFLFDDSYVQTNNNYFDIPIDNKFQPDGKLSEFIGSSPLSQWTLAIQDMNNDTLIGSLFSWQLDLTLSTCSNYVTWINLTDISIVSPPARYGANTITFDRYIFLFGGRDQFNRKLLDLFRFDVVNKEWIELTPINFDISFTTASSVGSNFFLTSWGLIRFGGYYRQPYLTNDNNNYDNNIFVMDPFTMKWTSVNVKPWPNPSRTIGAFQPAPRYLSGAVFIPSKSLLWRKSFSYRLLYDEPIDSTHANYNGALIDSILIFGGHDGASGSIIDGSTGGMLSDMWMIRLANWSTSSQRENQINYINKYCKWRYLKSDNSSTTISCINSVSTCDLRDLILLPFCYVNNMTMI